MAFSQTEVCDRLSHTQGHTINKLMSTSKTLIGLKTLGGAALASGDRVSPQSISRLQGYSSLQHTGSLVPEDQLLLASAWQIKDAGEVVAYRSEHD
jgi:hypothetical protein